ncbi:PilN domain-containing protein [Geoalkalibacter sp.]|jgi:type IV pilus assembly protein PilN|uniref:PilN domain-containing protein n=1 Tax=Geoalkalibacter sp. TaxID=3041440 RepID=UPI00272EC569|nr:PilN domain-containing protein [Geoalkalibacter sp.]
MIRINLLPVRAAQKKEKIRAQILVLILTLVVAVVACAGLYAMTAMKISEQKAQIARTNDEIRQLQKVIGEVGRYKKLAEELQAKLDVLNEIKQGQSGPVHLLDQLSQVLPQRVWLTSFKESGGAVAINGIGLNESVVATFMQNLEASPYYSGVELQVTEQITQDGMKLQRFSLAARAQKPAPVAATN